MTIINIISCELYINTKDFKSRIQPYGLALFFLVFLYDSPSALVLYWTFNNLFSLLKNKYLDSNPKKFTWILLILSILVFYIDGFIKHLSFNYLTSVVISIFFPYIILFVILKFIKDNFFKEKKIISLSNKYIIMIFSFSALGLLLLQSFIIPLGLFNSDFPLFALELDSVSNIKNILIKNSATLFGLYFIWISVSLFLVKKEYKSCFIIGFLSLFGFSLLNYLFFCNKLGILDIDLVFQSYSQVEETLGNIFYQILNGLVFVVIVVITYNVFKKSLIKQMIYVLVTIVLSEIIVTTMNILEFRQNINFFENYNNALNQSKLVYKFDLSKKGKNVIIIFLDRFAGGILPFIFDEKPELKNIYSGFVFYPNTVSFYGSTVLGYPPITGGYEYTPYVMDKDKRLFQEKWLESTMMLPTLFKNNNYCSTIVDPIDYFDYNIQFFIKNNNQNKYNPNDIKYVKMVGNYNSLSAKGNHENYLLSFFSKRLYMYTFFKISSNYLKKVIYEEGKYMLIRKNDLDNDYQSEKTFFNTYSALSLLENKTNINSDLSNTFTLINNELPHIMHFLQYPNYEYSEKITDTGIDTFNDDKSFKSYHTAMASVLLVGKFLDFLKRNEVYDNSRIIIVSDHGNRFLNIPGYSKFQTSNITPFNPLLMVKDFNQHSEIKKDETFMTNADVPYIATNNLIDNAKNPFTGEKISIAEKSNGIDIYMDFNFWNSSQFKSSRVILDKNPKIKHVKSDIFNESNWSDVEYTEKD